MQRVEILILGREEAQGLFRLYSIAYIITLVVVITVQLVALHRNQPLPAVVVPGLKDQIIILMKFVKTVFKNLNWDLVLES